LGVVVSRVDVGNVVSKVGHVIENLLIGSIRCLAVEEHLAESSTVSVLDSFDLDVRVVEGEVVTTHAGRCRVVEEGVDYVCREALIAKCCLTCHIVI